MAVAQVSARTGPVYASRMNSKMRRWGLGCCAPANVLVITAGVVRSYIIYACDGDGFDDNDDDVTVLPKGEDLA